MPDTPSSQTWSRARPPPHDPDESDPVHTGGSRAVLAKAIPRRPGVSWWLGIVLSLSFAALTTAVITAERWLLGGGAAAVITEQPAPFTVRAPMLAGYDSLRIGGGVVVARGEIVTAEEAALIDAIAARMPRGPVLYLALFALSFVLGAIFTHHMRRSNKGRLIRVQVVSLAGIVALAAAVKVVMASTTLSALVVPVAAIAIIPTMALDRIVGLATGVLAALVVSLLVPFDVGLAILLLVQAATAGLVISERPRRRWTAALSAGLAATLCTGATYMLLAYLTTGHAPELRDPLHSAWLAAVIGPAAAALIAVPLLPLYQLLVGEITQGKLFALEDLGHPLLRQIAERAPGTWQHSLMMANMAEIAANAIGASGRLVRVGAYFHDLGKSLQPRYFIENLEPGEVSPHDQLPPEVSCDAIFAHVTEGLATARRAGLHERIVDFMHMHHGNGVLEYFWAKCREQGNPSGFTIDDFRYPGHPPQSRETAILAICDAVEAASRTLKKPEPAAIDALVQRIVYGKLHLGQLDESGLSMGDLRRISDSLRETIRHANHGRIEYPWQKAGQDASASVMSFLSATPRLDSLDRKPGRDGAVPAAPPPPADGDDALAATADIKSPDSTAAARAASEGADPSRIRAGTARNAQPAAPVSARDALPSAPEPAPIELPRKTARARTAGDGMPTGEPAHEPVTFPGRPPGPLPSPEPITPASPTTGFFPASTRPATHGGLREPGVPDDFGAEPRPPRRRASTRPPVRGHASPPSPNRPPTDEMRTIGPPAPDLDNAITQPPPLRRGASGHPPIPSDPVHAAVTWPTMSQPSAEPPVDFDNLLTPPTSIRIDEAAARALQSDEDKPRRRPLNTLRGLGDPDERETIRRLPTIAEGSPASLPATPVAARETAALLSDPASDAAPLQPVHVADPVAKPATSRPGSPAPGIDSPRALADQPRAAARAASVPSPRTALPPEAKTLSPGALDPWPEVLTPPPYNVAPAYTLAAPRRAASPAPAPQPSPTPSPSSAAAGSPASPPPSVSPSSAASPSPSVSPSGSRPPTSTTAPSLSLLPTPALPSADPPGPARDAPASIAAEEPPVPAERRAVPAHDPDAGITEPSMPALDAPSAVASSGAAPGETDWSSGLAARIDAALDTDDWGRETPVVAPSKAELRALFGHPDPTRQQPLEEIAMLQRRAAELAEADALRRSSHPTAEADAPRRSPHPTAEVDPDDIEAAIELAPPARRPAAATAIGVAKPRPKKPQ
jgi:cyclic-di-AMP phosphodiesterase PgpH